MEATAAHVGGFRCVVPLDELTALAWREVVEGLARFRVLLQGSLQVRRDGKASRLLIWAQFDGHRVACVGLCRFAQGCDDLQAIASGAGWNERGARVRPFTTTTTGMYFGFWFPRRFGVAAP